MLFIKLLLHIQNCLIYLIEYQKVSSSNRVRSKRVNDGGDLMEWNSMDSESMS